MTRKPLGFAGLLRASRGVALTAAVLTAAAMLTAWVFASQLGLLDFKGDLYGAGQAILHGHNPYQPGFIAAQAAIQRAGGTPITTFAVPVYPAPALLAAIPFSVLPYWLAGALFTLASAAALLAGLRLLGVRDWRCLGLALVSWPTIFSLYVGALGPVLVLGAGIAWRFRDRLWAPAAAIAGVIVTKLFPWPLAAWLLFTRRYRAFGLTVILGLVFALVAWATIGFAGLSAYPRMLVNLSHLEAGQGPSLVGVLLATGVAYGVATAVALTVAGALLAVAWRLARGPGGDRRALGLAVMVALIASPIVWLHYLVLLFVPIALLSPTLSAVWFIPAATALIARPQAGHVGPMLFWLALQAIVIARLCWPVPQSGRTPALLRTASPRPSQAAG